MLIELAVGGALINAVSKGNQALKADAKAMEKRSRAFTRESEAQRLVSIKREDADKRMEKVAKKKRAIITVSIPKFISVYEHIQKLNIQQKERKYELLDLNAADEKYLLQTISLIPQKEFTDKELVVGVLLKGISGMTLEDSKRNLSAARSQERAAEVVYSQAMSIAELYDAIIGRSERIAKLLTAMNALFLGSISEAEKIISRNGTDIKRYSEKEKITLTMCVNLAFAITELLDIPILDENGQIAAAASEMLQTGEENLRKMNGLINEVNGS